MMHLCLRHFAQVQGHQDIGSIFADFSEFIKVTRQPLHCFLLATYAIGSNNVELRLESLCQASIYTDASAPLSLVDRSNNFDLTFFIYLDFAEGTRVDEYLEPRTCQ
tara:strand:+ start:2657 stop:2977 length:321 start_codon:yes stop_codon:yes gene_type:complete